MIDSNGGQGRNRTADASLFRAALYQLSYLARLGAYTRETSVGFNEGLLRADVLDYNKSSAIKGRMPGWLEAQWLRLCTRQGTLPWKHGNRHQSAIHR